VSPSHSSPRVHDIPAIASFGAPEQTTPGRREIREKELKKEKGAAHCLVLFFPLVAACFLLWKRKASEFKMADKTIPSTDPALDPHNQHHHAHKHHAPSAAAPDDIVYTAGTTVDPADVPTQQHIHNIPVHKDADVEKAASLRAGTPPDYSDHEKGEATKVVRDGEASENESQNGWKTRIPLLYRHRRLLIHLFLGALFTGWWIASLVLHHHDKNWVIPFLLWLAITLRLITFYVPVRYVSSPIKTVWKHTAVRVYDMIPAKLRTPAGAAVTVAVILVGSFVTEEFQDNTRENRAVSCFGMAMIIFVFWLTSRHRKQINWRTVIGGMLFQYIISLFVLRTQVGFDIFSFIAARAADLLGFAKEGFLFLTNPDVVAQPGFFFAVIPAIIFFISLTQVLFYIGFLQWFISKFAVFVFWALGVSGAEAVVAAATPFIGQGESAMLVRPFIPHMTKAEIHQILTCGFATISGSVLIGYIELGLPAEVLVSSCIMSIPASLAISKLRYPETEETLTAGRVVIPDDNEHKAENALHAFAEGAVLGIKIAGTIIASLLCIIAFVGLINGLLNWFGLYLNIWEPRLTLQTIFGYLFYPVSFCLGVPRNGDLLKVARLIAEKVITNEYNAFNALVTDPYYADLSPRSRLIATYACCGFGNIGSLGIQIGILGQLAPSRGGDVSRLAFSALVSGVMATLTSATVAGLVVTEARFNF
jgi:CNT family concentrative nucleoside transporter